MTSKEFINFANDFTGKNIKLLKPENNLKYARYFPYNGEIEPLTKYGIYFNNYIVFDFVTGKNVDNFYKTFVTQYINKYEVNTLILKDGSLINPTKKECIQKLKNQDRVYKSFSYTTLYGIGLFCFFMSEKTLKKFSSVLSNHLKNENINFRNEFSEAGWVYRFLIKKDVDTHNKILTNFNF